MILYINFTKIIFSDLRRILCKDKIGVFEPSRLLCDKGVFLLLGVFFPIYASNIHAVISTDRRSNVWLCILHSEVSTTALRGFLPTFLSGIKFHSSCCPTPNYLIKMIAMVSSLCLYSCCKRHYHISSVISYEACDWWSFNNLVVCQRADNLFDFFLFYSRFAPRCADLPDVWQCIL